MSALSDSTPQREVLTPLPRGYDDDKSLTLNASVRTILTVTDAQGDVIRIGACPPRTTEVHVQNRRCGDWYVDIKADRYRCAIGATREEACRAAIVNVGGELFA